MTTLREDTESITASADQISVFGAMNAGAVADLLESDDADQVAVDTSPVEIDLPEPDLRFTGSELTDPDVWNVRAQGVDQLDNVETDAGIEAVDEAFETVVDLTASSADSSDADSDEVQAEGVITVGFVEAEDATDSDDAQIYGDEVEVDEPVIDAASADFESPNASADHGRAEVEIKFEVARAQEDASESEPDDVGEAVNVDESVDHEESDADPQLDASDQVAIGYGSPVAAEDPQPETPSPDQLLRVEKLIVALREDGHLAATIDPLGLRPRRTDHLEPSRYGVEESTLDMEATWLARSEDEAYLWLTGPTVRDSIDTLRGMYCGNVGYEFEHVHNVDERAWLQTQVESLSSVSLMSDEQRLYVLELLSKTEGFERYLHTTFPGKRWYSLEGLDSLMVLIDQIVLQAAFEVGQIVVGMTHRGRLNVLAHMLDQPYKDVLSGFLEGRFAHLSALEASGWLTDVKYHQGSRSGFDINQDGAIDIVLRLLPNPSHLEMVTPAVMGAVRAIQDRTDDGTDRQLSAMALMIHGDAAFAGQGIVSESLNLMNLPGYTVGGAVHVIANNQIGFTTEALDAFSGAYASDVARGYEIPVVHVNADDVEACATVAKMAVAYRSRFRKDFVIDLVGYRRHGHNENDDPSITQPNTHKAISTQPTVREKWARVLIEDELITEEAADDLLARTSARMEEVRAAIEASGQVRRDEVPPGLGLEPEEITGLQYGDTSVDESTLKEVNAKLVAIPDDFALHQTVRRVYDRRATAFDDGAPPIDWAHAELLAFGTMLNEGINVRLTGQDVARGTFSQRHAALFDSSTGRPHIPLNTIESAAFWLYNSPLSEASPLGFEHGYSVRSGATLVIWEAQFGDFVNNAQSVIDEIVVSAKDKWGQSSSLVLLLPHGYEGQGPNHSHAHLERFLDLSACGNIRVAFPTTAAQYFHLLRTQSDSLDGEQEKRPLVIMSPKSLLRHPLAASRVPDFTTGRFRPVRRFMLGAAQATDVKRVVLCTGKVFVDVASHPDVGSADGVGVVVLEELYPFPGQQVADALASFPNAKSMVWLQEEPMNRGAWEYVKSPIQSVAKRSVGYVGRPRSPSPASGSNWLHRLQQDALLRLALGLPAEAAA